MCCRHVRVMLTSISFRNIRSVRTHLSDAERREEATVCIVRFSCERQACKARLQSMSAGAYLFAFREGRHWSVLTAVSAKTNTRRILQPVSLTCTNTADST
jgi:hypothetical protein